MIMKNKAYVSLQFNHDGSKVLGGTKDGYVVEFDLASGTTKSHLCDSRFQEDQNAVCYSKQNPNHAFSGGDNGLVTCWDTRLFGTKEGAVGYLAGHMDGITYIDTAKEEIRKSKHFSIEFLSLTKGHFSISERMAGQF